VNISYSVITLVVISLLFLFFSSLSIQYVKSKYHSLTTTYKLEIRNWGSSRIIRIVRWERIFKNVAFYRSNIDNIITILQPLPILCSSCRWEIKKCSQKFTDKNKISCVARTDRCTRAAVVAVLRGLARLRNPVKSINGTDNGPERDYTLTRLTSPR